jgi:hypothetical protein
MRRQEFPHYTPEQVAGHLDEAWRIVSEAGLPEEVEPAALAGVLGLLAAKQIVFEQVQPGLLPNLAAHH